MKTIFNLVLIGSLFIFVGCKKPGCTDEMAENFNPAAKVDDGSCLYTPADKRITYLGDYVMIDSLFVDDEFEEVRKYTLHVGINEGVPESPEILLTDMWGEGFVVKANLTSNKFEIPNQAVEGSNYVVGDGQFIGTKIIFKTDSWHGESVAVGYR